MVEEFIFDDDMEGVGAEIEAYCPKCRLDTAHIIVSKYEDEIRRVQCNPCADVHSYRKPRGEGEEIPPEEVPTGKQKKVKQKPTYEQIIAKNKKEPRLYNLSETFKELEVLSHPKFGLGFVSSIAGEDKIEVTFADEPRVLVHNKKGSSLPFLRPVKPAKGKAGKAPKQAKPAKAERKRATAAKKPSKKPAAKKPLKKKTAAKAKKRR